MTETNPTPGEPGDGDGARFDSAWIIHHLRLIAERATKGAGKEDQQIALRALELLARERGLFARPAVRPRRLSDLPVEELRAALARLEPR